MSTDKQVERTAIEAAIWITASPHEWVWTQKQQEAMARFCLLASTTINAAIRDLEKIVCVDEPDDGVVLLSNEGTTHFDAKANSAVYDHEHFSPLGDALIALHERLSGLRPEAENSTAVNSHAALVAACEAALSDLAWAERTVPGTNFQSSILKIRAALLAAQPDKQEG